MTMPARRQKVRGSRQSVDKPVLDSLPMLVVELDRLTDEARFENATIERACLRGASARDAVFDTCSVARSEMDETRLPGLRMLDVRMEKCGGVNADWRSSHLRRVEFLQCRLTGLSMEGADCRETSFMECRADFARFGGARLKNVHFEKCLLADADFSEANLENVVFLECDLRNLDLGRARLISVDLRGSALNGISIQADQLRGLTIDALQAPALVRMLGARVE